LGLSLTELELPRDAEPGGAFGASGFAFVKSGFDFSSLKRGTARKNLPTVGMGPVARETVFKDAL